MVTSLVRFGEGRQGRFLQGKEKVREYPEKMCTIIYKASTHSPPLNLTSKICLSL